MLTGRTKYFLYEDCLVGDVGLGHVHHGQNGRTWRDDFHYHVINKQDESLRENEFKYH